MDKIILILLLFLSSCKNEKRETMKLAYLKKENIVHFNLNKYNIIYSKYGEEYDLNKNELRIGKLVLKKKLLQKLDLDYLKMSFYQSNLNNVDYNVNGIKLTNENYVLTSFSTDNVTIIKSNIEWNVLRFQKGLDSKNITKKEDYLKIYYYKNLDSILMSKRDYSRVIDSIKKSINL